MRAHASARPGSVYLAVLVVVSAVTALVLTGAALRKHLHERAAVGGDAGAVRRLAMSAAEMVVHAAATDEVEFRKHAESGMLFDNLALAPGSVSASIVDADTKTAATPATTKFRVVTTATVGDATSRLSVLLRDTPSNALSVLMSSMNPKPIAYWPLDEVKVSGGVDRIGGRNAVFNTPAAAGAYTHSHGGPVPRVVRQAEFVRVPHHDVFELANGTLCFWVRFDQKPTGSSERGVIAKERIPQDTPMSLAVYLTSSRLRYTMNNSNNNGATIECSSSKITEGKWHFMAVTWGDLGMELYIDGTREAFGPSTMDLNESNGPVRPPNKYDWLFGARNGAGNTPASPIQGSVARVSLFNVRLSQAQIRSIHQADAMPPGIRPVRGGYATVAD